MRGPRAPAGPCVVVGVGGVIGCIAANAVFVVVAVSVVVGGVTVACVAVVVVVLFVAVVGIGVEIGGRAGVEIVVVIAVVGDVRDIEFVLGIVRLSFALQPQLVKVAIEFHKHYIKFLLPWDPVAIPECLLSCNYGNINHLQQAASASTIEQESFVPLNSHTKE